jgi:hypothetical protein
MAYVSPSNKTTGTLITASTWNQDIVANMQAMAPDVFTGKGDLYVGTAADFGRRFQSGRNSQMLVSYEYADDGLVWRNLVEGLQNGGTVSSPGNFYQPGTNDSFVGFVGRVQAGCRNVVIANGQTVGSVTITFPNAYEYSPLMFATPGGTIAAIIEARPLAGTSLTQASLQATRTGSTGDGTITVSWMSIGGYTGDGAIPPR